MTYEEFLNLDVNTLNRMSKQELTKTIKQFQNRLNTRAQGIYRSAHYVPAFETIGRTDNRPDRMGLYAVDDLNNVGELRAELGKMWRFATDRTSTKEGALNYYKSAYNTLKLKNVDVGKLRSGAGLKSYANLLNPIFEMWEELKDKDPDFEREVNKYAFIDALSATKNWKKMDRVDLLKSMENRKEEIYRKRIEKNGA